MPMTAARKLDVEEAFEIVGKKEAAVNKDTMGIILRSLGLNPTNDEINELFSSVAAGATTIDCAGVVKAAETFDDTMAGRNVKDDTTAAFAVFDKEATGKISAAELRHVIANLGVQVDDDEIDEMMAEADGDGDGQIDYSEFVQVILKPLDVPNRIEIPEELKPHMPKPKEAK